MRIISLRKLREFWESNNEAENSMQEWIKNVRVAEWNNFSDVRKTYNHADMFKCCVIFDVGGNKFRIIAKVKYEFKIVYIRFVLTHKEYDARKWQDDCESR